MRVPPGNLLACHVLPGSIHLPRQLSAQTVQLGKHRLARDSHLVLLAQLEKYRLMLAKRIAISVILATIKECQVKPLVCRVRVVHLALFLDSQFVMIAQATQRL